MTAYMLPFQLDKRSKCRCPEHNPDDSGEERKLQQNFEEGLNLRF